eukprot:SAG25_NODE_384_length_8785_cov_7.011628_8_plen_55_part_00
MLIAPVSFGIQPDPAERPLSGTHIHTHMLLLCSQLTTLRSTTLRDHPCIQYHPS